MKYLRVIVVVFIILSVALVLNFEQAYQPESSSNEHQFVEAGGKIIGISLSDGVSSSSLND